MVHLVQVRADAQRNRDRILAAARDLVAETGAEVTMDEIARRAHVAVGTLYRHFPAKEDLVEAVVADSLVHVAALAEGALAAVHAGAPPGAELGALFRELAARHATDRAFKAAAGRLDHDVAALEADLGALPPGAPESRALAAITELLERARISGEVRDDVTLADLVVLLGAVPGAEVPAPLRERYVDIVIAGITGPGAT